MDKFFFLAESAQQLTIQLIYESVICFNCKISAMNNMWKTFEELYQLVKDELNQGIGF
jgi:hypothetical protein